MSDTDDLLGEDYEENWNGPDPQLLLIVVAPLKSIITPGEELTQCSSFPRLILSFTPSSE